MIPITLKTEREAQKCSCPFYGVLAGSRGELRFVTCRAAECMAWRWSMHKKVENREARPTGFCGRIEYTPIELGDPELPEVIEPDAPAPTGSIITQ